MELFAYFLYSTIAFLFLYIFFKMVIKMSRQYTRIPIHIYFKKSTWRTIFRLSRWKELSFSSGEVKFTMITFIFMPLLLLFSVGLLWAYLSPFILFIFFVPIMCIRHIIVSDLLNDWFWLICIRDTRTKYHGICR